MKKLAGVLLFGIVAILAVSQNAAAQEMDFSDTRWELSGQVGAAIPKDDDSDTSAYLSGRLVYDVVPNVGIGGSVGWYGYGVEVAGEDWGDANSVPLLANIVLRMPLEATENRVVPYVVGGIGVMFWNFDESNLLKNAGISVDSEASFAAQIGAGVDFYLSDRIAVFGEATYLFSEVDTTISGSGLTGTLEGDTDAILLGVGAKMRF